MKIKPEVHEKIAAYEFYLKHERVDFLPNVVVG